MSHQEARKLKFFIAYKVFSIIKIMAAGLAGGGSVSDVFTLYWLGPKFKHQDWCKSRMFGASHGICV